METGVWNRFFCSCCQSERSLSDRVYVRGLSRCTWCANKRGRPSVRSRIADDEEPMAIPQEIVDCYREAME